MNELVLARALFSKAVLLVGLVVLVLIGVQLKWVLVQVFAAGILAAGVQPIVAVLTQPERGVAWRWRPPFVATVVLVYACLSLVVLVLGSILLGAVLLQTTALLQRVPEYAAKVQEWHADLVGRWSLLNAVDLWDMLGGTSALTQWLGGAMTQVLNAAGVLLALFGGALNVIFVVFIALYLTLEAPAIRDYLLVFFPGGRREHARRITSHMASRLGRWVVGQLVLCVIVGAGAGIVLGLLGLPGAALLALVWAVCVLIPGIGPFLSAVPTILVGFFVDPTTGALATVFAVVWSQIENNVMVPRVMSHTVKLNPLVVLVAVLVGHELLGIAGALFAIPLAAVLAVMVDELHQERLLVEHQVPSFSL